MVIKMLLGFHPLTGEVAGLLCLWCPWALEEDHGPLLVGDFAYFV
jgi:hypothetical protein